MANAKTVRAAKKSPPSNGLNKRIAPARKKAKEPEPTETDLTRPAQDDRSNHGSFSLMQRFSDEMDRLFGNAGLGRGWLAPTVEGGLDQLATLGNSRFSPQIEVFERDDQLVIRADLPGMTEDGVNIDIANEAVVIRGERKSERKEDAKGYYRSERSYGKFYRRIPLPEGVSVDQATADFSDGVLEIGIPAGQRAEEKRRRLEIRAQTKEQPRSKAKAAGRK